MRYLFFLIISAIPLLAISQNFGDFKDQVRIKLKSQYESYPNGWHEDSNSIVGIFYESGELKGMISYLFKNNRLCIMANMEAHSSLSNAYREQTRLYEEFLEEGLNARKESTSTKNAVGKVLIVDYGKEFERTFEIIQENGQYLLKTMNIFKPLAYD